MCKNSFRGNLLDGTGVEVTVSGTVIAGSVPRPFDPGLPYLLPPLVDLQHNGSMGCSYDDLESAEKLEVIAETLWKHGVGRAWATTDTLPLPRMHRSLKIFAAACDSNPDLNALFPGMFHEGIFITPEDGWRGDHDLEWLLLPDWETFRQIDQAAGGRFRMVNIAPELPGAMKMIRKLTEAGKIVSLGHSNASSEQIREAVRCGATRITHFGNGCAGMIPRFQNPLWEYLANPALKPGLICDGFHLPPETVKTALLAKGRDNCFAVSDASRLSSLPPGEYGHSVLEPDGLLHIKGQNILSGSSCQQDSCVNFLIQKLDFSLAEAWKLCSFNPARMGGISLPQLQIGDEATFVIARCDKKQLQIQEMIFRGRPRIH